MAAVIQSDQRIHRVHIDGLAVLKIVKHCQESLPRLATGSLLGLATNEGVLEITHSFPFPNSGNSNVSDPSKAETASTSIVDTGANHDTSIALDDGHEYQLEMMRMLREVNFDNNCVGWYQSMYLGSFSTASLLENQLSYQTDLSANAVVILYDPMQTAHGNLAIKCMRLTEKALDMMNGMEKGTSDNTGNIYLDPSEIFEQVPIVMSNPGLVKALLHNVSTGEYTADDNGQNLGDEAAPAYGVDTTSHRLDLSINPYLEKHLELLSTWVDDLASEQTKFQYYTRSLARGDKKFDKRGKSSVGKEDKISSAQAWASNEAPRRLESLLISNQIRTYCDQVDKFTDAGLGKLYVMDGLQKKA
jgi:translation initiation factor 3 subunit H